MGSHTSPNTGGILLFSGFPTCKSRHGWSPQMRGAYELYGATCSSAPNGLFHTLASKFESVTMSHCPDCRGCSAPKGRGAARKKRAHYCLHYLPLTQHCRTCEEKEPNSLHISILQYLLGAEPLTANILSEE